ncbi:MAG: ABC transporter ATP-binding protein [Bacilli bacterium]|jgi:iron complex transport system ATP-binding protein
MIKVKNLSFGYLKNRLVLDDISLEFEKGKIIALIGRNGSGKSTFIDCLLGVNDYKGEIFVCDINIKELSDKEYARHVSFIPQSVQINIDYSIRDFISFGRNPYLKLGQTPSKKDFDLVTNNAKKCGIADLLDQDINKISGGERQLAFIARALTQETPIIIMDEPTSALDFGNQQKLFKTMKELAKEGKTIIFTTHNPNHLVNLGCDIFAVKDKGILKLDELNDTAIKEIYGEEFQREGKSFLFKF